MADVSFTFSGDATSLQNALHEIKQELGKTKEAVSTLAGRCAMAFTAIQGGINAVKSAFSTLGSISSEAANMEQTAFAFKVMMGDAAAAAEYVVKLRTYAAETPFEFGDISDDGKTGTASKSRGMTDLQNILIVRLEKIGQAPAALFPFPLMELVEIDDSRVYDEVTAGIAKMRQEQIVNVRVNPLLTFYFPGDGINPEPHVSPLFIQSV